jgi:trk system potassium uptake protein TrkH
MNYRLVARTLGILLGLFSASILVALPFGLAYHEWVAVAAVLESVALGGLLSGALLLAGRNARGEFFRREALAVVGLAWILAAGIGALPFLFSGALHGLSNAYFESMSGLTTTGSSVMTNIEGTAKSILLWRSFTHFLGGLGIVVLFVAVLPLIGAGGRTLFKQEAPGPQPEGMTPRIKDTALKLLKLYVALNVVQAILLMVAGMSFYDAVNHAMATLATGGFSTRNASVASFQSPMVEWIIIVFMFLAGANFSLHLEALRGRVGVYWRDPEFRLYAGITLAATALLAPLLWLHPFDESVAGEALSHAEGFPLRDAMFNVIALKTTTGFGTVNFEHWPPGARFLLLMLMFVGGCAGSTGGGLKVIRWLILAKVAIFSLQASISPRRVVTLKLGGRAIDRGVAADVQAFFFLWMAVVFAGTIAIALLSPQQSMMTSLTAVIATLNNIGPGLEGVGPYMNYASQSGPAKWLLSLFMLLGRLELHAILVLLAPRFWRGE